MPPKKNERLPCVTTPNSTKKKQPNNKPTTPVNFTSDLPQTAEDLFAINQFPLLHAKIGIEITGKKEILIDMLKLMIEQALPQDRNAMIEAFSKNDWKQIQQLAHKIKGGAMYVGTVRLKMAFHYLEQYCKSGQNKLLENLYQQAILVTQSTIDYVTEWLVKNKD
jgi:two-component system, OmpR family, aerobic respiration control sensor histidine kinase ArcB